MFILILFIFTPFISQAAHFEGGSITYQVINTTNSTVSIMIRQTYIYVYPSIYCNNSYIINQSPKLNMAGRDENGKYLNCTANCTTSGGYISVPLNPYCTDYSLAMSITIGERSDIVTISKDSYFVVAFASNNWRPLTLPPGNSGSKAWSLSCTIDLRLRQVGTINNPPVAAIISPIYIPVGIEQVIFIPTIDADNDQVRCRFARNGSNECADVCPPASLPNGTILLSNCTLFITGAYVNDWYAVAIMIEDFIDSTSTTPLSSIPVQFLINVRNIFSCSSPPFLTGPVAQTGQCVGIQVGQTYVIELIAENFCPNSTTIKDIATLSFPVVIKTPIVQNTTTLWSISLTWIPIAAAIGSQVLCAVAIDSANVQSNQYCMTFIVAQGNVPICPGQIEMTTQLTTYTTIQTDPSNSTEIVIATTSLPTSIYSSSYIDDSDFHTLSSIMLEQSTNLEITSSSLVSSPSNIQPSNQENTLPWFWIISLIAILALILITLCLCCYCCYPLYCLCCPYKRRRQRSAHKEFLHLPIHSYTICKFSENISNDIIPTTRPPSNANSQYADDIQLTIVPTPRNKIRPHYMLPLRRAPRIGPETYNTYTYPLK